MVRGYEIMTRVMYSVSSLPSFLAINQPLSESVTNGDGLGCEKFQPGPAWLLLSKSGLQGFLKILSKKKARIDIPIPIPNTRKIGER